MVAKGGTAVLYKAIQTSLDRTVAVKKLHQHLTDDENFTRRFILEAKAAASLDHENIVHVIDFGKADGDYQIIMEYVEGRSLKDILREKRRLDCAVALAIAHQVCRGLEHAHAKGIVHRDIKPGNVLIAHYGRVKITDFGLAKLTQAATSMTAEESLLGTPLYMSPEQAYGESVDARSDLFSLGTMLYEMITGVQPFFSENCMGVINNIINCSVPPPSSLDPAIPNEVESIVMKALHKNREGRFRDAGEFRTAIEEYLGVVQLKEAESRLPGLLTDGAQTMILTDTPAAAKRMRPRRTGPMAAALGGILAVLAAVAVFHIDMISHSLDNLLHSAPENRAAALEMDESSLAQVSVLPDIETQALATPADTGNGSAGRAGADSIHAAVPAYSSNDSSTAPPSGDSPPAPRTPSQAEPQSLVKKEIATEGNVPAAQSAVTAAMEREVRKPAREGWIAISSEPRAELYVDGSYRAETPVSSPIPLSAGMHSIECRNPRYETYSEQIVITAGELSRRTIALKKLTGKIQVFTEPGAEFFLDGTLNGITPLQGAIEVEAGTHDLLIRKNGYNDWHSTVTVDAGQTIPLRIRLSLSFRPESTPR
jgi:serine/threonine protein kinase